MHAAAPPAPPVSTLPVSDGPPEEWSREVRRGFIRKVLFIVFFQLLLTTGVAVAFYQIDEVRVRALSRASMTQHASAACMR